MIEDNLNLRLEFHKKCEQDELSREQALLLFKSDIVSFFKLCLWTYDPRQKPADRPFILYDYQEEYARKINQYIIDEKSLLTEKSRDMGITWIILGVFLYRWLFFNENYLVGSRKESLVDKLGDITSLFERIRYMINYLPQWLLPVCDVNVKNIKNYMKLFKDNNASITGESTNEDFSRQGRYNAILLDEFASWDVAEQAWTACGDTAPSKFPVSTPKGSHNKFVRLKKSGQIEVETLHWHLHPDKNDKWYEVQKANRPAKDIAQELDINYTISAGEPFYQGFIRGFHSHKNIKPILNKELILGWDYGRRHPCCIITQLSSSGIWYILDCLLGTNILINEFGKRVKEHLNINYTGFKIRSFGDPAGKQEGDKSLKTSEQILDELGFDIMSIPSNTSQSNYDARKHIIEGKFKDLIGDRPSLIINDIERTQVVIEAFEGGLHYPEANRWGFVKEAYVRDGYYEHVGNSIEYIAVNLFSPLKNNNTEGSMTSRVVGDTKDVRWSVDDTQERYSPTYRKIISQPDSNYEEDEEPVVRRVYG